MSCVFTTLQRLLDGCSHVLSSHFARWTKPLGTSLPLSALTDLSRSKTELIAENALLRQQLIILRRQVQRPACSKTDRVLLVIFGKDSSGLEANALHCPARDVAAVASGVLPTVLEA